MNIPLAGGRQARADDDGPSGAAEAPPTGDAREQQALQREFDLFVGRVSHELQSVLQNTEGFAAALLASAGGKLDAREQHFVERIRQTLLRGNGLLHDMVGYYRLATCPIEPGSVSSRRAVELAMQRVQAQHRQAAVDWRLSGEWPDVRADAGLLEHALVELLDNAVKFSDPAAPVVVEIASTPRDDHLELRITDHGVGFDAADLPRLFQPCSRLHAPPLAGSGMGLATVLRIAQRLGGRVEASTTPDGAVFTLALPLATAAAPASAAAPGRRRVLLIDDDPLVLSSLSAMLQQAGCEVTPAESGAAALVAFEQALASKPFDIVVTDLGLPGLRGDELARRVKERAPATAVLVLTGQAPESLRRDLPEADGVLGKPLRIAALRAALAQLPAPAG